jgi:hypothetical protein
MFSDDELEKMSISDLQDLALNNPQNVNQIVKILNGKAIKRVNTLMDSNREETYQEKEFSALDSKQLTKLDLYKIRSVDYQAKKRAFGPGSWFFEFMTPDTWNEYEELINRQMEE